jgi:hypothetical protein
MKNATLADLLISAQTAANTAFQPNADGSQKDILARETVKLEEFGSSGFDRADFPTWENNFQNQLNTLASYSQQDSPATVAAKRAATAASAAAQGTKPA